MADKKGNVVGLESPTYGQVIGSADGGSYLSERQRQQQESRAGSPTHGIIIGKLELWDKKARAKAPGPPEVNKDGAKEVANRSA